MVMKKYEAGPPTGLAELFDNMDIMYDGSRTTFVIQDQLGRCRTESTAPHLCGHNQAFSVVLIFTVPR